MTTRHIMVWCERCPTRITISTEVPVASVHPNPEYTCFVSEGVALALAHPPTAADDGLVITDRCPACGGELHDVDELRMRNELGDFRYDESPQVQARWIEKRKS